MNTTPPRLRSGQRLSSPGRLVQLLSLGLVTAAVVGLTGLSGSPSAGAVETDNAVTISWAGGNGALQQFQPDRTDMVGNADGSGHWNDFKDLKISVSQTRELADQVIDIAVTGMAHTEQLGTNFSLANYVQAMQCWGEDPLADDFMQTCAYGSMSGEAGFNADGVKLVAAGAGTGTNGRGDQTSIAENGLLRTGEVFRSVFGQTNQPRTVDGNPAWLINGIGDFFVPTSSNEVPLGRLSSDISTPIVPFEAQSAAAQPYLGCGSAGHERCWLVIVPRGVHSGALAGVPGSCSGNRAFGDDMRTQFGSPMDRTCSFWRNRIVVPLDFRSTGSTCPPGAPERRILGTEFASAALTAWQPALCEGTGGSSFSLTTNASSEVRRQLVAGEAGLGLTMRPVMADELPDVERSLLPDTRLRYAPVANTAIAIAFIAQDGSHELRDIRLSPRLLAKLLTASYVGETASFKNVTYAEYLQGNPGVLWQDPEFERLNPGVRPGLAGTNVVMTGPQGDDAVRALWAYMQADDEARAFLAGQPDEDGMHLNPYFLPATDPRRLGPGLPFDLARDVVDTLPKADGALAPDQATADREYGGQRVDALAMSAYSTTFESVSQRIFRGDLQRFNEWDPLKQNSAGEWGVWSSTRKSRDFGAKGLLGATDLVSAQRYGLAMASLRLPNSDEFVAPTAESIAAGVTSDPAGDLTTIAVPDPAASKPGAYPLAVTVYAAADIDSVSLDETAREQYARFLDYAAFEGQIQGRAKGQLPTGYVPLTSTQRKQTQELAGMLLDPPPMETDEPTGGAVDGTVAPGAGAGGGAVAANAPAGGVSNATATAVGETTPADAQATAAGSAGASQAVLGGSLIAGLAGLIGAPFLLRRRTL